MEEGYCLRKTHHQSEWLVFPDLLSRVAKETAKEPPKLCLEQVWVVTETLNSVSALSHHATASVP